MARFSVRAPGLQHLPQGKTHGLLDLGVAVDLDIGAVPEVVKIVALGREQALEPGVAGHEQRPRHLILQGRAERTRDQP